MNTTMIAIQGPAICDFKNLEEISSLPRFGHAYRKMEELDVLVARTGYTGEDGVEIITDVANARLLWESFIKQGIKPCGLGARDSLRLEAGMLLYGQDIDVGTNPFEAGIGWLVDLNKYDFVGKRSLLEIRKHGIKRKLVGFLLEGREIARRGHKILKSNEKVGEVTSGGYSPTLDISIGLAYVPLEYSEVGTVIEILIRDKRVNAQIINRKFFQKGNKDLH